MKPDKEDSRKSELLALIPNEQIKKVFSQEWCDIDYDFLGFIEIYESLSLLIPKHFTVIDLGCAYNPQCFYFKDHKQYIAVDGSDCVKFQSDNCIIYRKRIDDFIKDEVMDQAKFNLNETFAICSYVPTDTKLIRETFKNLFIYYPHGGYEPFKLKSNKK